MEAMLAGLRAAAEATRLRVLAVCAGGAFRVGELCDILGQSQPRVSRHLKLLAEAGLLERSQEGANAWFSLPASGGLARALAAWLPKDDPVLAEDRRRAARVLAERARAASDAFRRRGADWDEMRALDLPAAAIETAVLRALPAAPVGRLVDIGTGTGRLLELLAPRIASGIGFDASPTMLALARARLARDELTHCTVRLADMYRLPLADAEADLAVLQMVLHHAEDPEGVIGEAARVLRPSGAMIVVDLAPHAGDERCARLAHRRAGFSDETMRAWLAASGLAPGAALTVPGRLAVQVWTATRSAAAVSRAVETVEW